MRSRSVTARALASRGLVRISEHGASWRAEPTERGRVWPEPTEDDDAPERPARALTQPDAAVVDDEHVGATVRAMRRVQRTMLTICHELHHAARMSQLGDTDSLLKKIVSEGLADQFELEIDPNHHPITYRKDLSSEDIQRGLRDLRQIIQSKDGEYDYYEWFFGYGKYPNWFGYTIGNFIISNYWEKSELTPAELVNQSAEGFIPFLDELIS